MMTEELAWSKNLDIEIFLSFCGDFFKMYWLMIGLYDIFIT